MHIVKAIKEKCLFFSVNYLKQPVITLLVVFVATIFNGKSFGQNLLVPNQSDSLFPVTNLYNQNIYYADGAKRLSQDKASVFSITSNKGKYYLFGDFTNCTVNHGSALVVDTLNKNILTTQKWKINGLVNTAIPDGQGGFYIGGTFTKIGDSSRKYLAQIDKNGMPKAWNPKVDSFVNQISQRHDTLFIAGSFSYFSNIYKPCFAFYSIKGDSILSNLGGISFSLVGNVTSFLIDRDTIVYAGGYEGNSSNPTLRKFSFKETKLLPWKIITSSNYYTISSNLQFNKDSSVIILSNKYIGQFIMGISKLTGNELYKISPILNTTTYNYNGDGSVSGIKIVGDKAYFIGLFDRVNDNGGSSFTRHGFAAFNATTGVVSADILPIDGYPSFIDIRNDRLILSGKFTQINGVARNNFVEVSMANFQPTSFQLSPTDPLNSIAFSGDNCFVAGYFRGINSVQRNGFLAIDSATNTILPWNPQSLVCAGGKRFFTSGDSLFVLGKTIISPGNWVNVNTSFKIVSLSTGNDIPINELSTGNQISDMVIDGNYLYVAVKNSIKRYNLPTLTQDKNWGFDFTGYGVEHAPMWLMVDKDTVYSVGDTRFRFQGTGFGPKTAFLIKYPKSTGTPVNFYNYVESNTDYIQPFFETAILLGNKIYLQGDFASLNGISRRNFVCINKGNGVITDWHPNFLNQTQNYIKTSTSNGIKFYNNKIWFGDSQGLALTDNSNFNGVGSIDTTLGNLTMPPELLLGRQINYNIDLNFVKFIYGNDFIINDNEIIFVGSYDSVNHEPRNNMVRYKANNNLATVAHIKNLCTVDKNQRPYIIEGCSKGEIDIYLNKKTAFPLSFNLSFGGNALNGIDVQTIPVLVTIPANDSIIKIPIIPIVDNLLEGIEQLKIYVSSVNSSSLFSDSTFIDIKDYDTLNVGVDKSICAGTATTIGVASTLGVTYTWSSNPAGFTSNISNPTVSPITNTQYYLLATNSNGCAAVDTIAITVSTPIITTGSITAKSSTIVINSIDSFYAITNIQNDTYQWKLNGQNVGVNSSVFTSATLKNADVVYCQIGNSSSGCYSTNIINTNNITITVIPAIANTNYKVQIINNTCRNKNDGKIIVTTMQNLNYIVTVIGQANYNKQYQFTGNNFTIDNLPADSYQVCFMVQNLQNYQQCFAVNVTQPQDITVYTAFMPTQRTATLNLGGGDVYNINLNGRIIQTTKSSIELSLQIGSNTVTVQSQLPCQGIVTNTFFVPIDALAIGIFPNPTADFATLYLPGTDAAAQIDILNIEGKVIVSNRVNLISVDRLVKINVANLSNGIYIVRVKGPTLYGSIKLMKQN